MPTEIEARFRADGPAPLARLAAASTLGGADLGPARTFDEVDVYLDTAVGALAVARWACRLRTRDGRAIASLKGPPEAPPSGGGIHRRPEVEGPATASHDPADWPSSPARDLVDGLRHGEPLVERLTLRQVRTERRVTSDGIPLAVLSIDAVTVQRHGEAMGDFHVVELELVADAGDASTRMRQLVELAGVIATEPGLAPDRLSKLERALQLAGGR
jgi:inorganic triphosphatase YgiF